MSRYGLIDVSTMTDPRIAFVCAQVNLHNGKRRLRQGYSAAGMAALYNAVLFGMHYYVTRDGRCASLIENTDLLDAASLFHALARAGVFEDPLAFNRFSLIVERALWQGSSAFDDASVLQEVEKMLTKLGVMPFDESSIPGEPLSSH